MFSGIDFKLSAYGAIRRRSMSPVSHLGEQLKMRRQCAASAASGQNLQSATGDQT